MTFIFYLNLAANALLRQNEHLSRPVVQFKRFSLNILRIYGVPKRHVTLRVCSLEDKLGICTAFLIVVWEYGLVVDFFSGSSCWGWTHGCASQQHNSPLLKKKKKNYERKGEKRLSFFPSKSMFVMREILQTGFFSPSRKLQVIREQ